MRARSVPRCLYDSGAIFHFGGYPMGLLLYDKPFKTIEQQIEFLQNHHKLIIHDKEFAKKALMTASYYDLINGYNDFMMIDDVFKTGVSIEYLYYFHIFDKNFQNIIFKYSIIVENILKTKIAYVLSQHLGVDFEEYLDPQFYLYTYKKLKFFEVRADFEKIFLRKNSSGRYTLPRKSQYIPQPTRHYAENHNHIPPWIILRNVSFGNAIDIYRLIKSPYKEAISDALVSGTSITTSDKTDFIIAALCLIKDIRNIVAHNLKFVTYRSSKYRLSKRATNIITRDKKVTANRQELNDVYACIISMAILLDSTDLRVRFFVDLYNLILSSNNSKINLLISAKVFDDYCSITGLPPSFLENVSNIINGSKNVMSPLSK